LHWFGALVSVSNLDAGVVRRAQGGDPAALDAVVRHLLPYLGRICGSIALERGEDALQETLFAVVKHLSALREPAGLRGWARQIAVRTALAVAGGPVPLPVDPHEVTRLVGVTDGTTSVDVREVLAGLTPEHRAVLVLRDLADRSESEIAGLLRLPVGTVKSRLHRARQAFRSRWST
jgi:RNA polymerase sigma-70 factor (ECF subfamily)